MTALRQSLGNDTRPAPAAKPKKSPKRAEGQREMLLPISGKKAAAAKETAKETPKQVPKKAEKPARPSPRTRKAG
jgi:DNA end-binding protein Ku